jgi:hypothetical protein
VDDTAPIEGFGRRPAWITPFHDDPDTEGDPAVEADSEAPTDHMDDESTECAPVADEPVRSPDRHPS